MNVVPGLLPVACLLLFTIALRSRTEHWTEAVLLGGIAWGTTVVATTETLGAAGALTPGGLFAVWGALLLALLVPVVRRTAWRRLRAALLRPRANPWALTPIVVAGIVALVVALAAPPNTFDSMAYHMSRVAHWAAQGSVANYPTAILRQLTMAPFAEYAMLHLYVLSGGDHLVNLVQWLAMAGTVAGVAAVARRLGAGQRAMLLAALFCATLPIGILEATGTKNDYVLAFWLVAAAWLVLVLRQSREPERTREHWIAFGAAMGLAVLTKATAYLFAFPFCIWLAATVLRRPTRRQLLGGGVAVAVALTINAPFFARNIELHGSPLAPPIENDQHRYVNERFDGTVLASNLLRNVSLQIATGWSPWDHLVTRAVRKAHRLLGIPPELPATTWMSLEFDAHQRWRHEDSAPNPLHFVLLLAAPAAVLLRRDPRTDPAVLSYALALAAGFVLFCAYLQWQPWHSRLHLPLLAMGAPLAGLALARIPGRITLPAAAVLLAAAAAPALLENETRPLFSARNVLTTARPVQYFANWPAMAGPYLRTARHIAAADCREVALVAWWNSYEYPLWALLGAPGTGIRLRHVAVENASAAAGAPDPPEPCALVALARHEDAAAAAAAWGLEPALDDSGVLVFLQRRGRPKRATPSRHHPDPPDRPGAPAVRGAALERAASR